jgi:hypothetical protein
MMGQGTDLWIAIGRPPGSHGGRRGVLIKFDTATSKVLSRTPIPATPTAITAINEAVWIASAGTKLGHGKLLRVDPSTGDVTHTLTGLDLPDVIASGPTALWASGVNGDLWRIDPKSYKVKRYAGYRHLEAITPTAMWTIAHGVQQRDPRTAKLVGQSSPTGCQPSFVVAAATRVWAVSCVKVGPDPQPEGPPQIAPMLFAYDIHQNRLVGPPIPAPQLPQPLPQLQRPLFAFGSIWLLGHNGLKKVDSSALHCQVTASCTRRLEVRYSGRQH